MLKREKVALDRDVIFMATADEEVDDIGSEWMIANKKDLFGNAEQLNLAVSATGLGGRATTGLGYNVTAQFIKPEYRMRDQSLEFKVGAIQQKLAGFVTHIERTVVRVVPELSFEAARPMSDH